MRLCLIILLLIVPLSAQALSCLSPFEREEIKFSNDDIFVVAEILSKQVKPHAEADQAGAAFYEAQIIQSWNGPDAGSKTQIIGAPMGPFHAPELDAGKRYFLPLRSQLGVLTFGACAFLWEFDERQDYLLRIERFFGDAEETTPKP